jgi:hypothetical protein
VVVHSESPSRAGNFRPLPAVNAKALPSPCPKGESVSDAFPRRRFLKLGSIAVVAIAGAPALAQTKAAKDAPKGGSSSKA